MYNGLTRLDARLQPQPDLATGWEASQDGRLITFTLRSNITWHDGRPLTADDVAYTLSALRELSPTTALLAASKAWAWLGGYPAITPDHVQTMLLPTWRHRIRLRPDAELEGVSVDAVLGSVVQQTRVPI